MQDAEAIVVGGGHNGLICAAYLARAGLDTLLVEARPSVGGCASTVDALGGRFNICNCDHTLIRAMPVIDELDLAGHGLRYLEAEASYLHLFHDQSPPWLFFSDTDRTLDGLSVTHPHQVANYKRYLADALPVAELVVEMAKARTTSVELIRTAIGRRAKGVGTLLRWSRMSAADVLGSYFDDWHLTMPAISAGPTVWGVPPQVPGTGLAALGYATRHLVRTGRPEGGSGALTDALALSFTAAGGRTRCESVVRSLVVHDASVQGVELTTGQRLRAPIVVTACDPHRVLVEWLGEVPPAAKLAQRRWRKEPEYEGYEAKFDAIVDGRAELVGVDQLQSHFPSIDLLEPTAIVSPKPSELDEAHRLRAEGKVAPHPTMLMNVPSVLDPTMRPNGTRHIFSLEVLFTPYSLQGGWPNSQEPRRWLELANRFWSPGFAPADHEWRAMTPDIYESEFHMRRGHAPSYVATPLATLFGRAPELSRYRSPVRGLYLSGAGTWPGAGVFGAPGHNTACTVLEDRRRSAKRQRASA